jgi:O-antigen ligase
MHNTYLDLLFEYGMVPVLLFSVLVIVGIRGIWMRRVHGGRAWLYYIVALAILALGQHLLYAFSVMLMLIPATVVLARAAMFTLQRKLACVSL